MENPQDRPQEIHRTARGDAMDLPGWLRLPAADRYLAATRRAGQERAERARSAGAVAVDLARELAVRGQYPDHVPEQVQWAVRGEPRHRRSFGLPHPGDFIGTGHRPAEYPA
jgi:hypothetical protein